MITNTKIALATAILLGAATALASEKVLAFDTCVALEGYPDCHPDARASLIAYSTAGESMAQKKPKITLAAHHVRRGGAIPAPK
jgi:hypothetical protein